MTRRWNEKNSKVTQELECRARRRFGEPARSAWRFQFALRERIRAVLEVVRSSLLLYLGKLNMYQIYSVVK